MEESAEKKTVAMNDGVAAAATVTRSLGNGLKR